MEIIRETQYRDFMSQTVVPFLNSSTKDFFFKGYDGADLHAVFYECKNPVRTVVIVHGFTESTEKFRELIWYFLNSGSNVCIYDQRGHARSYRPVEDRTVTHVDKFDEYVKDLEIFVDKYVPKSLPLRLFSHSMGGAVTGLYLEKHPDVFPKAVFSSPMIAPATGNIPLFAGKAICRFAIITGKSKKRLFISGDYPGKEEFETSCGTSFERFSFYEEFRRTHEEYQNFSPSYGWTAESLKVKDELLRKGAPEKIKAKSIVFNAGKDVMVKEKEQKIFASRKPDCQFISYESAKHEIFFSKYDVMEDYVNRITKFFE